MMIDPQNNLLSTLLAGAIGLLLLLALVLYLALGRVNLDRIEPIGDTTVAAVAVAAPQTGLDVFEEYNEILRRPVFFSDRRLPVLQAADFDGEQFEFVQETVEDDPVPELKASVAGIIITPEMRMAMIRDQGANRTMVLREGMSLEGEQAAWRLDRIEPRTVSFVSVDGRSAGLELEVNTRGLSRPSGTRPAAAATQTDLAAHDDIELELTESAQGDEAARARAEEIRRRVAERRAELRAEAERRARQQQDIQ